MHSPTSPPEPSTVPGFQWTSDKDLMPKSQIHLPAGVEVVKGAEVHPSSCLPELSILYSVAVI